MRFRTLLALLAADRLIILSTHIVSDIETIANHLVILCQGELLASTTSEELIAQARGHAWSITTDPVTAMQLQKVYLANALINRQDKVELRLVASTSPDQNAVSVEPNLEDAYLWMVSSRISAQKS